MQNQFPRSTRAYEVQFTPNSVARLRGLTQEVVKVTEVAVGTKDAINKASQKFDLDFRMVTHPGADGLATAYADDGVIVGQFQAKRSRKGAN
jgi:hypothetical protein